MLGDRMQGSDANNSAAEASGTGRFFRLWTAFFYIVLGVLVLAYAVSWWLARPSPPGPFYEFELSPDARPGQLLRVETHRRGVPDGAVGWRILYATTGAAGDVRPASALVVASAGEHPAPRPVVAWAHGTTGIMRGCAPSMMSGPFDLAPGFPRVLDPGWVWVAADYTGLGTPGPHPYLVGPPQAHAVLDAVRAAGEIERLELADRAVVWGHSQGGHAALWAGIVAPAYAPDIELAGIAAVAPATDLPRLLSVVHRRFMGRMLSAYLVEAYAAVYPDVDVGGRLRSFARPLARDIADRCLDHAGMLASALPTLIAGPTLFREPPPSGAFAARLAENVPDEPIEAPVLIVQGSRDTTVTPGVQGGFVSNRCLAGQVVDYRGFADQGHLSIVDEDSPVPDLLLRWTRARFAGEPAPVRCRISGQ
ncbi:MAG: lipase family protein [Wenzhouxiangellaceae bacterium]